MSRCQTISYIARPFGHICAYPTSHIHPPVYSYLPARLLIFAPFFINEISSLRGPESEEENLNFALWITFGASNGSKGVPRCSLRARGGSSPCSPCSAQAGLRVAARGCGPGAKRRRPCPPLCAVAAWRRRDEGRPDTSTPRLRRGSNKGLDKGEDCDSPSSLLPQVGRVHRRLREAAWRRARLGVGAERLLRS